MFRADIYEQDHEISIFNAIQLASQSHNVELVHFLISPQVLGILSVTGRRSMTVNDIAHQLNLPLATCYKLVEQMVEFGLMARVGTTRTSSRGRAANYTSSLKSVTVSMMDMQVDATVTWKNGEVESFHRDFRGMTGEPERVTRQSHTRFSPANRL